jgi:hypothetical protein
MTDKSDLGRALFWWLFACCVVWLTVGALIALPWP